MRHTRLDAIAWVLVATAGAVTATIDWVSPGRVDHANALATGCLALVAARFVLVRAQPVREPAQTLVLLGCVATVASLAAPAIATPAAQNFAGLGVALLLAVFIRRRPAVAVVALFAIASTYTSIQAFLDISPYPIHLVLLAGLLLSVVLGYISSDRQRRPIPLGGVVLFALFIAVTGIYALLASNSLIGHRAFYDFAWYMIALVGIAYAPWSPLTHERIARGILVVIALVSAYAVFRWIVGPAEAERALVLSDANAQYNFSDGKLNVFGTFPNTRSLGVWAAAVLPMCVALALYLRGRWRVLGWLAGAAAFAALLGSGLRTGIVAAILGCLLVMALMTFTRAGSAGRLQTLVAAMVALSLVLVVVIAVSPDATSSTRSYSAILHPQRDESYQARLYKWSAAWRDAEDHPFGQGLGTAGQTAIRSQRFVSIAWYDVDNSYLKIALDQGIFGLGLFVVALLAILAGLARRTLATTDPRKAALGAAAVGTLGGFMVSLWTGNYVEGLPAFTAWTFVGLGLAQFATAPATAPLPSRLALPRKPRRRQRARSRLAHT